MNQKFVTITIAGLSSPNTRRVYKGALEKFLTWLGDREINKAAVNEYKACLIARGLAPQSVNLHLAAIKRMVNELADLDMIDELTAARIARVKKIPRRGAKVGRWLTLEEADKLINAPPIDTLWGVRDRAVLATLLGCGLRRSELTGLRLDQLQERGGYWIIADILGKAGRTRSIAIPTWTKAALDAWLEASKICDGLVFRQIKNGGKIANSITGAAIDYLVGRYGKQISLELHPHDVRRSFALLCYRGGVSLDQVQMSLGHAQLATTQIYLNIRQDLADAPGDHIGLR